MFDPPAGGEFAALSDKNKFHVPLTNRDRGVFFSTFLHTQKGGLDQTPASVWKGLKGNPLHF